MIRKPLTFLSLALCLLCALAASAQMKTGRWTTYSVVGELNKAIETPDRTYLHLGPSLFSISDDNEAYAFNASNKLSSTEQIVGIWYNPEGKYLFVAYQNGNIDIIHDDGEVVNMSDIADAILTSSRGIRDVAFGNGRIYVATDFGLVVFDEKKHQVIESGIYNQAVDKVMSFGDNLVVIVKNDVLASPYDIRHNQLDKFERLQGIWYQMATPLGDNKIVYVHSSGDVYVMTLDFAAKTGKVAAAGASADDLGSCAAGVFWIKDGKVTIMDADGTKTSAMLPDECVGTANVGDGFASVWASTADGVMHIDLSADTPKILMQPYMPEGITMTNPADLAWSADGSRLYVSNIGVSHYIAGSKGDGYHTIARTSYIEEGSVYNAQPAVVKVDNANFNRVQAEDKTTLMTGGPSKIAVDPDDKGTIYIPNRMGGVFVVKDREVVNLLNSSNVPYTPVGSYSEDGYIADIDQDGNLWFAEGYNTPSSIKVLPAEKRRTKIANVEKGDWTLINLPTTFVGSTSQGPNRDYTVTFCRKSDYNFIFNGDYNTGIVVMDNNGTPSNFRDDRFYHQRSFSDQGGNALTTNYITCVTEDADGKIWVGTDLGMFVIDNPADAMKASLVARRPIVPRNDGTQLGDYLLSTEKIYAIAVDPSNRKWFATESSGAYLVSADGTEIIQHFTAANSGLPSDCVLTVSADMNSNKVYFGTSSGLVCYDSDSSPAAEDFSEVYAYPNPVRPEYTGWVTIANLMDGSLVKIADAAGNVFFQGRSEGGMVSWDACDASGNRVRSGVYYVFASQNASGKNSGAVAKILVIN